MYVRCPCEKCVIPWTGGSSATPSGSKQHALIGVVPLGLGIGRTCRRVLYDRPMTAKKTSSAPSPTSASTSGTNPTPDADLAWCDARRADVEAHLQTVGLAHGRIGEAPAFYAVPYASLWAVESKDRPEWIGFWAIAGDLPTDALPAHGIDTPRDAMRAFGKRWTNHASAMEGGEVPQAWRHLSDGELLKLTAQFRKRGPALTLWADDASAWPAEPGTPADPAEAEGDD